ncbi:MAG: ATP-binding protein [Acidobacteriota bacterium]
MTKPRIGVPRSIKWKYAVAFSILIVGFLLLSIFVQVFLQRRGLKRDIDVNSLSYSLLARKPICEAFEVYYNSGYYKFREIMLDLMKMNPDLQHIAILDVNGWQLFDSLELDESFETFHRDTRVAVQDAEVLKRVRSLEASSRVVKDADGNEILEVIAPYVEEWGHHKYSVQYLFSYASLRNKINALLLQAAVYSLAALIAAVLLSFYLSSKITTPLVELTDMSREIARGNYGRTIYIDTRDEVQDLASSFNSMSMELSKKIAEVEASRQELIVAYEELRQLDRLKSDILANVSHELRTPLTTLRGYTESMADGLLGSINRDQEKALRVMERSLNRLAGTIGQLLEYSRLSSGKISLDIRPFDIMLLIRLVLSNMREEFDMRQIAVEVDIPDALPPVQADEEKIAQVVENLLTNSLKFTPPGGKVDVHCRQTPEGVMVSIRDNGVGIPEKELPHIFDRFHQVDGTSTRKYGGLGLGLAIVKQVLDAHGAAIQVASKEGEGSQFTFTLAPYADQRSTIKLVRVPTA